MIIRKNSYRIFTFKDYLERGGRTREEDLCNRLHK
jgi:hypothetical protein